MKKSVFTVIIILLSIINQLIAQNTDHLTENLHDHSKCQSISIQEFIDENKKLRNGESITTFSFVDYNPIQIGTNKSVIKIKVNSEVTYDSLYYHNSSFVLLDNGEGYDEFSGDNIYTSNDSIITHTFLSDIMDKAETSVNIFFFENGNQTTLSAKLLNYAITNENLLEIPTYELKKVTDSIYYNKYVINYVTPFINFENFLPIFPDLFSHWQYDWTNNVTTNDFYLEYVWPQAIRQSLSGAHAGSGSYGFSYSYGNLNRRLFNHELNHMIINGWSNSLFTEFSDRTGGHWMGLEESNSFFGAGCYGGVFDSVYVENGNLKLISDNSSGIDKGQINNIEKVLWGHYPIDSIQFPIKIVKDYNNLSCLGSSIIQLEREDFEEILNKYISGRTHGYQEERIPTVFAVFTKKPLSHDAMNVFADAIQRRESYLKNDIFEGFMELDYKLIEANNYFLDLDQDGFYSDVDCDDNNPNANPTQLEEPYNGLDDDCDETTLDDDLDQDGYLLVEDCDDNNPNINPNQVEDPYNGLDDDCNESTLDDDIDQDGFLLVDDCDDNNPNINPAMTDIPDNGIDEDCDGQDATTTSVHKIGNSTVNIYPNPVSSEIKIEASENIKYEVQIYDLNGTVVLKKQNCSVIEVLNLVNGQYILELTETESNKKIIEKIIVER